MYSCIIYGEEGWDNKLQVRFQQGRFLEDAHACCDIVLKCWKEEYNSTNKVLRDVDAVEKQFDMI